MSLSALFSSHCGAQYGSGAFMKTVPEARELAAAMVAVGRLMGRRMVALLTDMSQPLGRAVGNALEVEETIAILRGQSSEPDLLEVTLALGREMLLMAGAAADAEAADRLLRERLASGAAWAKFQEMVAAQGGDLSRPLPRARFQTPAAAARGGYVQAIDSERIGWAAIALGAGRRVASDAVDHAVGFTGLAKVGDRVEPGHVLALVHHNSERADAVVAETVACFTIGDARPAPSAGMVLERIE